MSQQPENYTFAGVEHERVVRMCVSLIQWMIENQPLRWVLYYTACLHAVQSQCTEGARIVYAIQEELIKRRLIVGRMPADSINPKKHPK